MTSREFYQLIDHALEPECKRLGLSRRRGGVSLWSVSLSSGVCFFEIFKGVKSKYVPPLGGRFNVHCDVTPSPDPKSRGMQSEVSCMEYFSSADLEVMREVRDRVLYKIVDQSPTEEFDQMILEMHTPLLRMEIGQRFNRHKFSKLPYWDAEDVSAWGQFFASRLEQTLIGLRERPVFLMRVEAAQPVGPPNGGAATPFGNSSVAEVPPSAT